MRKFVLFSVALGLSFPSESYSFTKKEGTLNSGNLTSALLRSSAKGAVQNTVQGTVKDGKGPVSGVSVFLIGGTASTKTDAQGQFKITAAVGSKLRFSSVGYVTKEVTVTSGSLDVTLSDDNQALEEVVVVGYGTQKKGNLTGVVSTINVKDNLQGRAIADVGRGIQGTTPGLTVVVPSGEVGSDPVMKIRGQMGSIAGGSSPLILLDNVEIPSIQLVNPADVESISVLKDAAASSIYGAKAAFGVVLITTKKGAKGGDSFNINYSNNFSFQNSAVDYNMGDVNALKYSLEAAERVGESETGAFYKINRESYQRALDWKKNYGNSIGANDPTVYGRDWYVNPAEPTKKYGVRTYNVEDYMIRKAAPTSQHDLSLSGTSGKTQYNLSMGLLSQSGMMKTTDHDKFNRTNAALRISSDINKYLTVRGGAMVSRRKKEYPYTTSSTTADPWLYLYRWSSLYPMGYDDRGNMIRSPWSETSSANTASFQNNYINLNLGATVNIKKNWKVDFDYTFSNQEEITTQPGTRFTAADSWVAGVARKDASGNPIYVNSDGQVVAAGATGAMPAYDLNYYTYTANGANPDHFLRASGARRNNTINAFTTYDLNLDDDHDFKFIAGVNRVTLDYDMNSSQTFNLLDIRNPQLGFGVNTSAQLAKGDAAWEAQLGYFGRVNYAYKNKYLVEANIRYDGSSKFPKDLKWQWFPSFSAGWVASEESFMEWAKPTLNQLKFRGSWGSIGDQTVPPSLYTSTMIPGDVAWLGADGSRYFTIGTPSAVRSELKWQRIETTDIGLDMRMFNNKLGLVFDWYRRDTKNMIVPSGDVSATFGAPAPQGNFGALRTQGWELALDFNHRFESGFGFNVRGTLSDAKTTILQYTNTRVISDYYNGKDVGEIWGYRTDRLYQVDDFEYDASGKMVEIEINKKKFNKLSDPNGAYNTFPTSSNFKFGPGDVKFTDLNGDGQINAGAGTLDDHGDMEIIGNETPRYEYGFRLGFDYKGFDLSGFMQGVGKRQIWGNGFLTIPGYNASDGAMPSAIADNFWSADHTGAFYPRAYNNAASNDANNMVKQSRYLLDMSYLRIKNITLGYTLPSTFTRKAFIKTARVYTSLENFFTFDKLNGLPVDPEAINGFSIFNATNYNSGRTGVGTPMFKSVSFGVQVNF